VGYNDCVGYRAGTLQAYRLAGTKQLLELPLHIMDTALFYPAYLKLAPQAAEKVVDEFIEEATKFGGALTINWHDRSLAPERQWDGAYVYLLAALKRANAWCPTAGNAANWFQKRRSVKFEKVVFNATSVRIRATMKAGAEIAPALRLRIHSGSASFKDVVLSGDMDEAISLQI